ncbi:hypothetical protein [Kitasatospora sp. NPDC058218]|uniref:hypothetical protein n=1 Tax=Kitasatospora sp. NPDC058218 TaxID=3346385 RepID=UPI0036DBC2A1
MRRDDRAEVAAVLLVVGASVAVSALATLLVGADRPGVRRLVWWVANVTVLTIGIPCGRSRAGQWWRGRGKEGR